MTKLVILNGPPRCGKDTGAAFITRYLPDVTQHVKLSQPIKDIVHGVSGKEGIALAHGEEADYREAQINTYLAIAKVLGSDWMARICANQIRALDAEVVVFSDGGRPEEVDHLIREFGKNNVLIVHIFRKNTSFEGDIRQYIYDSRVVTKLVMNDDLEQYHVDLLDEVTSWLGG